MVERYTNLLKIKGQRLAPFNIIEKDNTRPQHLEEIIEIITLKD